jgi:2-hydroxy-6-oxonona-2,4-dienedioate hydrolase
MTFWTDLTGVPFAITWVDAGGLRTRSLQAGPEDGEPVVFLHGTSGHLEAFVRNVPAFVAAGYRVHAIDMAGHGYTDGPGVDYEIPVYVRHLLDYLDAVGIDAAHLVGESLGGWVSARLAAERPERVRTLQLVAAGGTKANPAIMEKIKSSTTRAVLEDDLSFTRKRLELLMHDPADVSDELVEVRHAIYHQPAFQKALGHLLAMQTMEIRQRNLLTTEQMNAITAPTLVVWGRENPFGDVPEAQHMHEAIAGSRLELFEQCGHWPQHEHADRFNALSIEFIRGSMRP